MDTGPDTLAAERDRDRDLERVVALARRIPFVTLVHLIERILPGAVPVGTTGPFSREAIRLRHDPSLGFQSSDISLGRIVGSGKKKQVEITSTFLGLTGTTSPLPLFAADELGHAGDDALLQRELLDIFHHRLLSLLVRGILKFDYPRSFRPDGQDAMSRRILALSELSSTHVARATRLPVALLLRLAPLLTFYPKNLERLRLALTTALEDDLAGAAVRLEGFAGGYVPVQERERPRLGRSFRLGQNASLGARVRAPASKIRVCIGPLDGERFERFSPTGDVFALLCAVTQLMLPETLDVEVELTPSESIDWRLSVAPKVRLSRSTWLGRARKPEPVRFTAPRRIHEEVP